MGVVRAPAAAAPAGSRANHLQPPSPRGPDDATGCASWLPPVEPSEVGSLGWPSSNGATGSGPDSHSPGCRGRIQFLHYWSGREALFRAWWILGIGLCQVGRIGHSQEYRQGLGFESFKRRDPFQAETESPRPRCGRIIGMTVISLSQRGLIVQTKAINRTWGSKC